MADLIFNSSLDDVCRKVGKILPQSLQNISGTLQKKIEDSGVLLRKKLLLSSRRDNYITQYNLNELTVCNGPLDINTFAIQNKLPRLSFNVNLCTRPYVQGIHAAVGNSGVIDDEEGNPVSTRNAELILGGGPTLSSGTHTPRPGSFVGNQWRIIRRFLGINPDYLQVDILQSGIVGVDNSFNFTGFTCDTVDGLGPNFGGYDEAFILYRIEVQCNGEWP